MNELSAFLDFDEKTARFDTPECVQLLENMYDFAFAPDSDYTTSGSDNFSDYFAVYNSVPSPVSRVPGGVPERDGERPKTVCTRKWRRVIGKILHACDPDGK